MRSTSGSLAVRTIGLQELLQRLCVFYRVSTLIVIEIDKNLRKIDFAIAGYAWPSFAAFLKCNFPDRFRWGREGECR